MNKVKSYKVNAAEGLNLCREPTTKDGKKNVILSMPNGTIVTLESAEVKTSDGHTWYNVVYQDEDGAKRPETGWADSDCLEGPGPDGFRRNCWGYDGQQYELKTGKGVDLRREPTLKATTKDGKKNVILSMPNGTIVTLESVYVVDTSDGHTWYNVRHMDIYKDIDETGWVASDYLEGVGLGENSPTYTFEYDGKTRKITDPNLKTALDKNNKYLSGDKLQVTESQFQIELNLPQGKKKYWTTKANLKNIQIDPSI